MKVVIDIPEEVYKRTVFYREFRDLNDCVTTIKALENGTPLPKGHGDLIDRDDVKKKYPLEIDGLDLRNNNQCLHTAMDDTPTIIEADKEGEE